MYKIQNSKTLSGPYFEQRLLWTSGCSNDSGSNCETTQSVLNPYCLPEIPSIPGYHMYPQWGLINLPTGAGWSVYTAFTCPKFIFLLSAWPILSLLLLITLLLEFTNKIHVLFFLKKIWITELLVNGFN